MNKKRKYMSVAEMGKLLGLKKTGRYWLLNKGYFNVITLHGKKYVDIDSFEEWYANQLRYHKINGVEPGEDLKERVYTLPEIMDLLGISRWSMYEILRHNDLDIIIVDQKQCISKDSFWDWYNGQDHYQLAKEKDRTVIDIKETLTIKEAEKLLGISRSEFYNVRQDCILGQFFDYVSFKGRRRITKESFLRFLQNQDKYRYKPDEDENVIRIKDEIYLTIEQASWAARVRKSTIISWYRNEKISYIRAGKRILIPLSECLPPSTSTSR